MSLFLRCVSLTAIAALIGVAAASDVKGPVHISSRGVTDFDGDTARFEAAMAADERGEVLFAADRRIVVERAHADARRVMAAAHAHVVIVSREVREAAREDRARAREMAEEAREAAEEARDAVREAQREARIHVAKAMAAADEAMQDARERLAEARQDIAERTHELHDRTENLDELTEGRWEDAVEIRDGKVVRCNNPAAHPGTGCTPFTAEEKARIEAEVHAAAERAKAAMAQAEAEIRAAEEALGAETNP